MNKNDYLQSLYDHLISRYGAKKHVVFGAGEHVNRDRQGDLRRRQKTVKSDADLRGIVLDLRACKKKPKNIGQFVRHVSRFATTNGLESRVQGDHLLTVRFDTGRYRGFAYAEQEPDEKMTLWFYPLD